MGDETDDSDYEKDVSTLPPNKRIKLNDSRSITEDPIPSSELSNNCQNEDMDHATVESQGEKFHPEKLPFDNKMRKRKHDGSMISKTKSNFEDVAQRMMAKMGYKEGLGLGKHKQGRLEPVEAHKQRGYSGLGFHNRKLEEASLKWNPAEEEVKVKEEMQWLENSHDYTPQMDEMGGWIKLGPKKVTIEDETEFCDAQTVANIINSKTVFDTLDKNELRRAIARANPFETIKGAFFINRAAVKMANIDRACDFMFTNPQLQPNELLYFADVCAGPGGFSEYILYKKNWHAKGFGLTLKHENDFKLSEFRAGNPESFCPFYGEKEDGDVFNPKNQEGFRELIMNYTGGKGVHFMMSDGGFSVEGQENIQEILSKQLYLCQCLVALMIVRENGHFVTKLFDLFTPFSAGLVYLMYRCFKKISIFKPNTSRPANSERYLICKGKRSDTEDILNYFSNINRKLLKKDDKADVLEIVPLDVIKSDNRFMQYLTLSNETYGRRQVNALLKAAAYCEDSTLVEMRQAELRKKCLDYWEIPDQPRSISNNPEPKDKAMELLKNAISILSLNYKCLTNANVTEVTQYPRNWYFAPCEYGLSSNKKPTFYIGMGGKKVYFYSDNTWKPHGQGILELPRDTLVYAELVTEYINEHRTQVHINALHILDAYVLGGENISKKDIEDRHKLIVKFCKSLEKPRDPVPLRARDMFPLSPDICENLIVKKRLMKGNRPPALGYDLTNITDYDNSSNKSPRYFIPNSVLFFKSTAQGWSRHFSKTYHTPYVFNGKTGDKKFENEKPEEAVADFVESYQSRYIWHWRNEQSEDNLSMDTIVNQITLKYKT